MTFQFLVMESDSLVFQVFPLNRVQQRLWRSSLTFPFLVEVFKVFARGKVHLLFTFQLVFMKVQVSLGEGFFSDSSPKQKSAKVTRHSSARVSVDASSSTLSAHQMAPHDERTTWYDEDREQA